MGRHDMEARTPMLPESIQLRLAFITHVYNILTLHLLTSLAFALLVASFKPLATFFGTTTVGVVIYVVVVGLTLAVMAPLYLYRNRRPLNFILLGIFTLCFGFIIGLISAFINGKVVVEAVLVATFVVISVGMYTRWAVRRGQDFIFLFAFVIALFVVVIMFTAFQIFHPMGNASEMLPSAICVVAFSAYIVYYTHTLMEKNSFDDYIWDSVSLYLDILTPVLKLVKFLGDMFKR